MAAEPRQGEVFLFKDSNYAGHVYRISQDAHKLSDYDAEKKISSVKCGPNTKAILYPKKDFQWDEGLLKALGPIAIVGHTPNLGKWNDKAMSMRICPIGERNSPYVPWYGNIGDPGPGEVWLFGDGGFNGPCWRLNADVPNLDNLNCNNCVSSVRVGPGTAALLYDKKDFHGESLEVTRDMPKLGKFDDKAGAVKIRKA